ncbi:MAG: CHASE2 domain-containing protein [Synechococcaceae cyanobacterium SM1_2_3]|nr:CHASE2 domain-containing protein [Synechococcaceae cyanobacterium SM1_2_3]
MPKLEIRLSRPASLRSAALIAGVALALTILTSNLSFFVFAELKGLDLLFTLHQHQPPPDQIVIVAIDEPSMAEIKQQWPWPRSLHAQLIRQLHKAGAKVIGFDILFAEPSQSEQDQALVDAVREANNVVLVSALSVVNDPLFRHTIRIDPIPALREVATVGNPFISIDGDGVVRRARLLTPDMPSFALQTVKHYLETSPAQTPNAALSVNRSNNPFNYKTLSQEMLIHYRGPPNSFRKISYYQALDYEQMLPPGVFSGKIVLVGRWLEAIPEPQRLSGDTFLTPFSWVVNQPSAGVEIQANLISNLLEDHFVTELTLLTRLLLLLPLLLASSVLLAQLRPLIGLFTTLLLVSLLFAAAVLIFAQWSFWLPVFSGMIALILVYAGHLLLRALTAERERRRLLEEMNRDLESKIVARTQELSSANQELQQRHQQIEAAYAQLAKTQTQLIQSEKMASLGLLVAGVAHELNNPISYVSSNLEFIEDYVGRLINIIDAYSSGHDPKAPHRRRGDVYQQDQRFQKAVETLYQLIASCKDGAERVKKIVLDLRVFSRTDDLGLVLTDIHQGTESALNLLVKYYQNRITITATMAICHWWNAIPARLIRSC